VVRLSHLLQEQRLSHGGERRRMTLNQNPSIFTGN
jgi:hypothetical protein